MTTPTQRFFVCALHIAALTIGLTCVATVHAQSITDKSCVAHVLGEQPGSQVNIRSGAGMNFSVIGTVSVGNLVIAANDDAAPGAVVTPLSRLDPEGYPWYLTARYRASEYRGWMRADHLLLHCPNPI